MLRSAIVSHGNTLRAATIGLLIAFIVSLFIDISTSPSLLLASIVAIAVALLLARATARHIHCDCHTEGVHSVSGVAVVILFITNILHPAVDGFSFFEVATTNGPLAGLVFGLGVFVHELFRQTALIAAFRIFGIKWYWVIVTALSGVVLGVGAGVLGSELFHEHEQLIDVATIFAYTFIIGEFFVTGHGVKKNARLFVFVGLVVGILLSFFSYSH